MSPFGVNDTSIPELAFLNLTYWPSPLARTKSRPIRVLDTLVSIPGSLINASEATTKEFPHSEGRMLHAVPFMMGTSVPSGRR